MKQSSQVLQNSATGANHPQDQKRGRSIPSLFRRRLPFESRARRMIKESLEGRRLAREKLAIAKRAASGKISKRLASAFQQIVLVRRKLLLLKIVYHLMRGEAVILRAGNFQFHPAAKTS
jgi:hypothetical protein